MVYSVSAKLTGREVPRLHSVSTISGKLYLSTAL